MTYAYDPGASDIDALDEDGGKLVTVQNASQIEPPVYENVVCPVDCGVGSGFARIIDQSGLKTNGPN
jgi:hypothetical protein